MVVIKFALVVLISLVACSEVDLRQKLNEIDAKIKQNEARLKAIEGMRLYVERNKISKVGPSHIEELAALYQKSF
jgi:hypothetical protein